MNFSYFVARYEKGQSPIDILTLAAHNYATAIKSKSTDPNLHLQLGLVLEEIYYAEDIYGLKTSSGVRRVNKLVIMCMLADLVPRGYKAEALFHTTAMIRNFYT